MEIKYRLHLNNLLPENPVTVELGVAEGYFSSDILNGWNPSVHYMVDNYGPIGVRGDGTYSQEWHNKNMHAMKLRVEPYGEKAKLLRGPTARMAEHLKDNSVDLVYVDACHYYDCVKSDIEAWWPKLKVGGIMAFHDYESTDYGVKQAVTEFANSRNIKINLIPEDKLEDAGAWIKK